MPARVVLITPARRFIANRFGLGYQVPLGLVYIAGPLVDAGHTVKLIDNDVYGWSFERLVQEIIAFKADYVLLGHTGSTAAHAMALATISAIRKGAPKYSATTARGRLGNVRTTVQNATVSADGSGEVGSPRRNRDRYRHSVARRRNRDRHALTNT